MTTRKARAMSDRLFVERILRGSRLLPRLRQQAKGQTLTQDVWVDAQHRPVQAEVATPDLGGPKTEPMTITYSRWGKPVTVERPPADQTQSVDTAWGSEVPPWLE